MRILFIGSGPLACPALDRLLERQADEVVAVVTQPDRPRGRQLQPAPCPVKAHVADRKVPVLTPTDINAPDVLAQLKELRPELTVIAAYGQFLKRAILDLAPLATINIHPSLLPLYRGAAPVHWAIIRGDRITGVSIMHVNLKMDAGDIILQEPIPIDDADTAGSLESKLSVLGARLLDQAIEDLVAGRSTRTPQDETRVVFAPKLEKAEGRIDWSQPARDIRNRIRGLNPWPGAFTYLPIRTPPPLLKIHQASLADLASAHAPGTVITAGPRGLIVACGGGALALERVQPEGRPVMDAGAFCCGYRLQPGLQLG